MRTTVDIDDDLLRRAKEAAAKANRPLREVIEDALRESLSRGKPGKHRRRIELPVSQEPWGLCPGVNLDDNASLLDLMERGDGPS
jgi:hypothetical protein